MASWKRPTQQVLLHCTQAHFLAKPSGNYVESLEGPLFPPVPELLAAPNDIYRYPLRETVRDTLNRQLRSGIDNEQLA